MAGWRVWYDKERKTWIAQALERICLVDNEREGFVWIIETLMEKNQINMKDDNEEDS